MMLSARESYVKCWNYKLGTVRRYSLSESPVPAENGTEPVVIPVRKSSDQGFFPSSFWNDLPDSAFVPKKGVSRAYDCFIMPDEEIKEFRYSPEDFVWDVPYSEYIFDNSQPQVTKFDLILQNSWTVATEKNVFRYKLDSLDTKILPGNYGFVAQMNAKRATERRAADPFYSINEPFDPNRFNFTKIKKDEFFFSMLERSKHAAAENGIPPEKEKNFIIANVSPLEYCNVLLVPRLYSCRPQVVTPDMLRLALHTILLSGSWKLRVGFNSIGAMASVNHLHCHAYYLSYNLPTESLPAVHFAGPCFVVKRYPSNGFVFQFPPADRKHESLVDELEAFIQDVYLFINGLHKDEIPHNIFITRGTPVHPTMSRKHLVIRVYVWTREFWYGSKDDCPFNAALCELSGHLPVKTQEGFAKLTEGDVSKILHDASHEMFFRAKPVAERVFRQA